MVWFRIDDAFDDHPKVLAAGNAACGLWSRCGAYSSRYLLEGFVPGEVARAKGTKTEIAKLITAGLWEPVDGGYRMHDFLDYNPSEEHTKTERAKTAKRQKEWRDRRAQRDETVSDGDRNAVTNGDRNPVSNGCPDPTRPDPTPLTSRSLTTSTVDASRPSSEDDRNRPPPEDTEDGRLAASTFLRAIRGTR